MKKTCGYSKDKFPGTSNIMTTRRYPSLNLGFNVDNIAWELGSSFLLFTAGQNKGQDLLITSHGGYYPFGSDFIIPPRVVLSVLGPHKHSLIDPKIHNMVKPSLMPYAEVSDQGIQLGVVNRHQSPWGRPKEHPFQYHVQTDKSITGTYKAGRFRNYTLCKFEDDTELDYDGIRRFINSNHFGISIGDASRYTMRKMDVLSVRHRPLKMDPTLKDAITALIKNDIYYERIILCFCRSSVSPFASFKEDYYAMI
ncbi:putative adhesin [Citrobacter youngae]|nr:hypothetical protein [Citrobacter youngae]